MVQRVATDERPFETPSSDESGLSRSDTPSDESEPEAALVVPPDGGWGWVVVAASFMCNFVVDGIIFTGGLLSKPIQDEFNATESQVAPVMSLLSGFYLLVGPFVSALANKYGFRMVTIAGSLIASFAFAMCYFASSVQYLYLVFGFIGEVPHPVIVPVPQPYPVKVPVPKPVAVPVIREVTVPVEKPVPYPVVKKVPYPIEKPVAVPVVKQVHVPVMKPYPVTIPQIKPVFHHSKSRDDDDDDDYPARDKKPYYKKSKNHRSRPRPTPPPRRPSRMTYERNKRRPYSRPSSSSDHRRPSRDQGHRDHRDQTRDHYRDRPHRYHEDFEEYDDSD